MSLQHNAIVRRRAAFGTAVGAALALTLAGCSSDDSPAGSTTADRPETSSQAAATAPGQSPAAKHNDADVEFTTEMIGHHRQAVMMADLVEGRTQNRELITLADAIEDAQDDEIDQMAARLKSWGVPVTGHMEDDEDSDHGDGMDHGDMGHGDMEHGDMPGMMSAEQMAALRQARGGEFDRLWLEGMIRHHEGAIAMADEVLANGTDPATRTLATQVRTTQQAEIDQMRAMLGQN
ncbi:DUF305 domain-containing protein [Gordonia metallireducens]|uniref:DUF305 domain-containing protein n=1 Tax=Gordonia metallireducens TaxID=2897779 RepID=UPI001E42A585|nr:DUF305 domain-containing protein [Gordonia metallireducens]